MVSKDHFPSFKARPASECAKGPGNISGKRVRMVERQVILISLLVSINPGLPRSKAPRNDAHQTSKNPDLITIFFAPWSIETIESSLKIAVTGFEPSAG